AVARGEPEIDASARRCPVERVGEQVRDDLQHAVAVGDEQRPLPQRELVLDVACPRLLRERRISALAERPHVDFLAEQREAASVARSRTSPTGRSSRKASSAITSSERRLASSSSRTPSRSAATWPRIAVSGVRSSCETDMRKWRESCSDSASFAVISPRAGLR